MCLMVFGYYYPAASYWHRRDPRVKIIVLFVLAVMALLERSLWWQVSVFIICLGLFGTSRLPRSWLLATLRSFRWLLGLTFLVNLVFIREGTSLAGLPVTDFGLYISFSYFFRLANLLLLGCWLMGTTESMILIRGISTFFRPLKKWLPGEEVALVMGMALRFFPLLLEEANEIALAQRARGVIFRGRRWRRKLKGLISMVIPLFLSTLRRSGELARAMEARGFVPGAFRTSHAELAWAREDTLTVVFSSLFLLAGITWRKVAG